MWRLKNKHSGFTLIEVMIVLAISSLLAVVLLNAYSQQQRRARFTDAVERVTSDLARIRGEVNASYTTLACNPICPHDQSQIFFGKAVTFTTIGNSSNYTVQPLVADNSDTISNPRPQGPPTNGEMQWGVTLNNYDLGRAVAFIREPIDGDLNVYIITGSSPDPTQFSTYDDEGITHLTLQDPTGLQAIITIDAKTGQVTKEYVN